MDYNLILIALTFIFLLFILYYVQYVRNERIHVQKEALVGDLKYSTRTHDHPHWLICDGRSLDRTKYHHLFEVIGTTYGSGSSSSSTTFNLPDCRGRTLGAIGHGANLTNRVAGTNVGEETHLLTINELVSHTHTGTTVAAGHHVHNGITYESGEHSHTGYTNAAGEHNHTHNAGGGQNNVGLAVADGSNTVIDTDGSSGELNVWTVPRALHINNSGSHSHTVTTDTSAEHSHMFTTSENTDHVHTFTSAATGGSQAFNVMQPTLFAGNVFIYTGC